MLGLDERGDHQPRVFHILTGDACKRHRGHLAREIGRADAAHKSHHAVGIVCQAHQRAADGLIIRRQLACERADKRRVALFHRKANALKVSQRILRAGRAPRLEEALARRRQVFAGLPEIFRALPGALRVAGVPLRVIVVALRLGAARRLRAERQQAAPVFAARQFVDKPGRQRARRRQRRVRLNKLLHRDSRLVHEIVSELAILQIGIERIGLQGGHQLLHHVHLPVIPRLFDLRIAAALLVERIGACGLAERQQADARRQPPPDDLSGCSHNPSSC
ncbi:hypothetical protein BN128_792 [Cronobacter sakazakii 696]|nr:hypothetical protein BN128_792 [Cronobacter sakazakii 696]